MYSDCGSLLMTDFQYRGKPLKYIAAHDLAHLTWFSRAVRDNSPVLQGAKRLINGYSLIGVPIRPSPAVIETCRLFGIECAETTKYYETRGQFDSVKWQDDHTNGKIGEWIAKQVLSKLFSNITEPDTEIYGLYDKSWRSDLIDTETEQVFAVKTQTVKSGKNYGISWVFQNNDPKVFGYDAVQTKCVFVVWDSLLGSGYVAAISNLMSLRENNLFKPLRIVTLNSKKAIYYEDLKKFGILCEI